MTDATTPDYVRSITERAKQLGVCDKTLRNTIARGEGPIVTRVSRNRIGIRDSHWNKWLESREEIRGDARPAA
jgi:hypothetical protein